MTKTYELTGDKSQCESEIDKADNSNLYVGCKQLVKLNAIHMSL